jgi:hypothetical protein
MQLQKVIMLFRTVSLATLLVACNLNSTLPDRSSDAAIDVVSDMAIDTPAPLDAPPTGSAISFGARVDFPTGTRPQSIAVGDFNADGKPDVAFAHGEGGADADTASVLLNTTTTGSTTPNLAAAVHFAAQSNSDSVAVGDLNGDGKLDLAVANRFASTFSIFLSTTGTGATTPTFGGRTDFPTTSLAHSVAIGDFNGDGKPDLAVTNDQTDNVSVFLNTTSTGATTPTFATKVDFPTGGFPLVIAIGDLNGDGKPDLVVANGATGAGVSVLFNTTTTGATTPTFASKVDFAVGGSANCVAIGDLNADGKPDLVVGTVGSGGGDSFVVTVLLNTTAMGATTPSFALRDDLPAGKNPSWAAVGDLNGDGKPDIAAANTSANTISVFVNTTEQVGTAATFALKVDLATPSAASQGPVSVAMVDVNGDGKLDLAVGNYDPNNVSVFLNTTE